MMNQTCGVVGSRQGADPDWELLFYMKAEPFSHGARPTMPADTSAAAVPSGTTSRACPATVIIRASRQGTYTMLVVFLINSLHIEGLAFDAF